MLPKMVAAIQRVPDKGFCVGLKGFQKKEVKKFRCSLEGYLKILGKEPIKIEIEKIEEDYFLKIFMPDRPEIEEAIVLIAKQFVRRNRKED